MDSDFRAVADSVSRDDAVMASFMRLAAKSGNAALQSQMLFYNADRMAALAAKVSRLEESLFAAPSDDGHFLLLHSPPRCPDAPRPKPHQPDTSENAQQPDNVDNHNPGQDDDDDGGGSGGDDDGGEEDDDDRLVRELERTLEDAEDGGRKRDRTEEEDHMVRYLERPTKMRRTLDRFYELYGAKEVSRAVLGEFMRVEPDVLQRSSTNKLFRPPKGFDVSFFVRKGSFVRLAKQWLDAWERHREQDKHSPAQSPTQT